MQLKALLAFFVGINKIKKALASGNMLTSPSADTTIHAGQTMEITWSELSGEKIDLTLMSGEPDNLQVIRTIALDLENNGQLPWTVSPDTAPGEYTVRIATKNGDTNYSPFFTIYDPVSPMDKAPAKSSAARNRKWSFF